MEQAGRDPSRDPQHDRTLDAMMSNTHTSAVRESENSEPSEPGRESRKGLPGPVRYCEDSSEEWSLLERSSVISTGDRCDAELPMP